MQNFLKNTALATAIVFSTTMLSAQAATPTDASLTKLMQVTHTAEMIESSIGNQIEVIEPVITSQLEKQDLTPAQRRRANAVITKYVTQLLQGSKAQVSQIAQKDFIDVAKKNYTQEEVDAQIAFYSSEVGQSIVNKQPKVLQEFTVSITPKIMTVIDAQANKIMPLMEKELKAITGDK